jgi:carbonic anhydrase
MPITVRNIRLRPSLLASSVMAAIVLQSSVAWATWQTVLAASPGSTDEHIEVDKSRIERGFGTAKAWSRISLGREVADISGAYNAIEALNSYDCEKRLFTTQRRVYFKDATVIREEAAVRQKANTVQVGSIDERLFNEACKPRTVSAAVQTAELAGRAAMIATTANAVEPPTPLLADMRTLSGDHTARVIRVADAHGEAAPVKPNMIALPKIDKEKAAAEAAAAGVTGGAATKAAAEHGAAPKPLPPKVAAPVAKSTAPENLGMSGHARELMLATSGPAKAKKKELAANPAQQMHVHWGYDGEGAPANWGKLDPKNSTCDIGKRQSPIDIRPGISVDLEPIKFNYKPTKYRVLDNGHTIQVNVGAGSTIEVQGKRFELAQFHFHKPSEERINGRPYPMVIHFVHKDWDDNLAVIAVLLDEGSENPTLQSIWNNMPLEASSEVLAGDVIEPMRLMPDNRAYWTYMGSLTTPPCTENVLWMVMKNPQQVSPEQIGIFARLYKNNARPIQPSNGRLIKESR